VGVLPFPERVESWVGVLRAWRWIDVEQRIWAGLVDYSREGLLYSHWVNGDLIDVQPDDGQAPMSVPPLYREPMYTGRRHNISAAPVKRLVGITVVMVLAFTVLPATPGIAASGPPDVVRLLESLPVRAESNRGYSRERFDDWTTRNGCDTRQWVLIDEARGGSRRGCDVRGARWWSYLDGVTTRNSSTFDGDHTVALAEAWGSGARNWKRARRDAFANDRGYRDSLIAASASSNRSKGDRSPAEWFPPRTAATCRLVQAWIAVKWRWGLSVDGREKSYLSRALTACPKRVVPLPQRAR